VAVRDRKFHPNCFVCESCSQPFNGMSELFFVFVLCSLFIEFLLLCFILRRLFSRSEVHHWA
jgi:hypothetical protein